MLGQNIKNNLRFTYDMIAKDFSDSRKFVWPELSIFIPHLPDSFKILDLGCGNGRLLSALQASKKQFAYQGADFSEELIKQAKKQWPEHDFQVADIGSLDFPASSFDAIVMVAVFHHLYTKKERQILLRKINTWLKPGGLLFMTNWNLGQKKYWSCWVYNFWQKRVWNDCFVPYTLASSSKKYWRYYHHFTKRELTSLLKSSGFSFLNRGVSWSRYNLVALAKKSGS